MSNVLRPVAFMAESYFLFLLNWYKYCQGQSSNMLGTYASVSSPLTAMATFTVWLNSHGEQPAAYVAPGSLL